MADQHFKITGDALGVKVAAEMVEASLRKIDAKMLQTLGVMNSMGDGGKGLHVVQIQAAITEKAMARLDVQMAAHAASINRSLGSIRKMPSIVPGGIPGAPGIAPSRITPALPTPVPRPFPSGHPGAGPSGGKGPKWADSMENKPLFNNRLGLGQGEQIQNALTGLMPLIAMGAAWGAGIGMANEQNVSEANVGFKLGRTGKGSMESAVMGRSAQLAFDTGADNTVTQGLMGNLVAGGETDINRASANARLAMDLEAAGGNAEAFVTALSMKGPEAAAAIAEMAESMGIQVKEGATLNEMLASLSSRVGGLSEEVESAKGSWPALFAQVVDNLTMFGDSLTKVNAVDSLTALLAGDTEKAGFIDSNSSFGQAGFASALTSIGGVLDEGSDTPGMISNAGEFYGNRQQTAVNDMQSKALENLNKLRQSGDIDKDRHSQMRDRVQELTKGGDMAGLYDYANKTSAAASSANASVDGAKGGSVAASTDKMPKGMARGPNNNVTVVVKNDPHSPRSTGARAF